MNTIEGRSRGIHFGNFHEITDLVTNSDYVFSKQSISNLETIIFIKRLLELPEDSIFFVYGSTARGTVENTGRLQEIQFWEGDSFLGNCFRKLGSSDIDLRIITPRPEQLLPSLEIVKQTLGDTKPTRIELRIDSPDYVKWEVTRSDTSSFYRRLLMFNRIVILQGKAGYDHLTELVKSNLKDIDHSYETERKEIKAMALRETQERPFVYLDVKHLRDHYPVYYSDQSLSENGNDLLPLPLKVSLVKGESSLVIAKIGEANINQFLDELKRDPRISTRELIGKLG